MPKEKPVVLRRAFLKDWMLAGVSAAIVRFAIARFRAADNELAAHEVFIVQLRHRALRFIGRRHGHEAEAFGLFVVFMGDDLGVFDDADALEQVEKIALGGIVAEVADVELRGRHFDGFGFACAARRRLGSPLAILAGSGSGFCNGLEET